MASTGLLSSALRTRLTSLSTDGLFQLTSAASSVLIGLLRRLRHERENMSPSCERLSALSTEPWMSIPIAAAFCDSVNVRSL